MEETVRKPEISKYSKFKKVDGATYRRVNEFLRKRTYITAREWALARLCTDFRTRGGAEMTFIGQHLPELVPFMQEPYSPQAVNQARNSFKKKVNKAGATFFYGAMCGFFTPDELDDMLFESSEVARFLLEVEGTSLDIDEEIDIEDRITRVMRGVGEAARIMLEKRAVADLAETEERNQIETSRKTPTPETVILAEIEDKDPVESHPLAIITPETIVPEETGDSDRIEPRPPTITATEVEVPEETTAENHVGPHTHTTTALETADIPESVDKD
jgi:hypothetical protein